MCAGEERCAGEQRYTGEQQCMPVSAPRRQDGVAARALPAVGSVLTPKPAWSPSLGSDTVPGQRGVAPAEPMAGRCLLWETPWRGVFGGCCLG